MKVCPKCEGKGYTVREMTHWKTQLTACNCPAGKAWGKAYIVPTKGEEK